MAESALSFEELSDDAKKTAVAEFARFYVRRYRTNGLDIFAQLDQTSGYIADINQYLFENTSLHSDELLAGALQMRSDNFAGLISDLDLTYDKQGHAKPTLAEWYAGHVVVLPNR
ncbi:hypothetical protein PQ472_11230 [Lacticaseibacillus pabuli]|uniref:Uncharacterized protein n=1 Tax=Lacticaseibacillus pabuli TaxID=3025672 RepID=A0ABY7WTT3_9LACO|nr:hypothetical protein [Lacticaseibacillus sp. KACC 23028]WDF82449.1 hypothetical protein PQ472_11230 [Lacticaseibacillus sp. KACC 23028]